jgi:hypothetical protein
MNQAYFLKRSQSNFLLSFLTFLFCSLSKLLFNDVNIWQCFRDAVYVQFFPLLLKLIASNGERLERKFSEVLPLMMSAGSFLPLFLSLMDLPSKPSDSRLPEFSSSFFRLCKAVNFMILEAN